MTATPDGPGPIRVLLADDHAAIRAGLRLLVEGAGDMTVVGEAADGRSAVTNARALRPDVVVMDVRMPGTDGVEATGVIVGEGIADVLVLTTFDLDEVVFGALRAGASGFLLKTAEPEVLLDAIRRVAGGDGVVAPEVTRRVLATFVGGPARGAGGAATGGGPTSGALPGGQEGGADLSALTEREVEVLAALGRGLSNAAISAELVIAEATVKTHVSRVLAKLQVGSRMQAAIVARESGLA